MILNQAPLPALDLPAINRELQPLIII